MAWGALLTGLSVATLAPCQEDGGATDLQRWSPSDGEGMEGCSDENCREYGECTWDPEDEACVARGDDCRRSLRCRKEGRCTAGPEGECVATFIHDCEQSDDCADEGYCRLEVGAQRCGRSWVTRDPAMAVAGANLLALGGASLALAVYTLLPGSFACTGGDAVGESPTCDRAIPIGFAVGGALLGGAIGAPLFAVGMQDTPPDEPLFPYVAVGPTGGALRWRW